MKTRFFCPAMVMLTLCLSLLLSSCGGSDAENAENKDTVSTNIEPQPDNASVRPDTMQTQVPQDSAMKKDSTQ